MTKTPDRGALVHAANQTLYHLRSGRTMALCNKSQDSLDQTHAFARRVAALFVNALTSPGDEGWILMDAHRFGGEFGAVHGWTEYPLRRHDTSIGHGPYSPMTILEGSTTEQIVEKMIDDWRQSWWLEDKKPDPASGHTVVVSPLSYGTLLGSILENAHGRSAYAAEGGKFTLVTAVTDPHDYMGHSNDRVMFTEPPATCDRVVYMDDLIGGTIRTVRKIFRERFPDLPHG